MTEQSASVARIASIADLFDKRSKAVGINVARLELAQMLEGAETELAALRAALAQAQQYRGKWLAAVNERNETRGQAAQAQAERDGLLAEIKELRERLAHEGAEVENCLKNIAELTTQRRALEIELSDALEELRLIKQTTRPVPGGLLDEKNQHGEYSMDTLPFDYQAYGIAGEPGHDTSGKPCWCGATADGAGVIVHRDIAEVLTSARQLGQFDAQPDYAAARSAAESELRAIAHIYGTADGLEPINSVSGMLSQISNIIAGVVSQRDAATARATSAEDAAYSAQREAARLSDVAKQERDLAVGFQQDISHLSSSLAKTELARRNATRRAEQAEAVVKYARDLLDPDLVECVRERGYFECGCGKSITHGEHCTYCLFPKWMHDVAAALDGPEGVTHTAPASASDDLYPSAERTDRSP